MTPGRTASVAWSAALALAAVLSPPARADEGIAVAAGDNLAAAIAAAPPGATIQVGPGTYRGPIVIDRPLRLLGSGRPVLDGGGRGDVVLIRSADVVLRGFRIRGSGDKLDLENSGVTATGARVRIEDNVLEEVLFGIYLKEAAAGVLRGNQVRGMALPAPRRGDGIRLWYSGGSRVEDNEVSDVRDVVIWFSPDTVLRGNRISGGRYGVHTMYSDRQTLAGNVLEGNSVGAFLMYGRGLTLTANLVRDNRGPSGYGVGLKDVDDVIAEGNRFIGNRIGIHVDGSPREADAHVRFDRNVVAYNSIGVQMLPSVRRNTYRRNAWIDNEEQVAIAGGGHLRGNLWSEDGEGNYWSDYAGFDADGDGTGDVPYVSRSLYEDLMAKNPALRLFRLGPAADGLDLAARAFPVFSPREKMSDPSPLMAPPTFPVVPGVPSPSRGPSAAVALTLLAVGGAVLLAAQGSRPIRRPHLGGER